MPRHHPSIGSRLQRGSPTDAPRRRDGDALRELPRRRAGGRARRVAASSRRPRRRDAIVGVDRGKKNDNSGGKVSSLSSSRRRRTRRSSRGRRAADGAAAFSRRRHRRRRVVAASRDAASSRARRDARDRARRFRRRRRRGDRGDRGVVDDRKPKQSKPIVAAVARRGGPPTDEIAIAVAALLSPGRRSSGAAVRRRRHRRVRRPRVRGVVRDARVQARSVLLFTPVPIRPRRRGERRSLRTLPSVSLRPPPAFNPRPRRLSTPLLTPFNSTPTTAARTPPTARSPRGPDSSSTGASHLAPVRIRPRRRGERRSLRTFCPSVSLRPGSPAFNPRPRRLSTPRLTPFNSTPRFASRGPSSSTAASSAPPRWRSGPRSPRSRRCRTARPRYSPSWPRRYTPRRGSTKTPSCRRWRRPSC